ncbi:hypothetical protein [Nocardiopsis xinjiangensis]|uniref:hypothetical protein n=1 Tax=Nocardiopsis xinjiangensis TaxID=124285 RepID=UPI000348C88B|nr:hypothetical protein [Nocardiopsis xinjiangensis]
MDLIRRPLAIIRADLRAYLWINALTYGAVLLGMALAAAFPDLHAARTSSFIDGGNSALIEAVIGNPWLFGATILGVNVIATTLPLIVLPSLAVPFAGLAVFTVKTIDIGIMLAPVDRTAALTLIPHSLTLLIEFQAYILVMFGAYLLGRTWLRPASEGAATRRSGYFRGLSHLGRLAVPALALFVIGAVYEVAEIYFLVPPILGL